VLGAPGRPRGRELHRGARPPESKEDAGKQKREQKNEPDTVPEILPAQVVRLFFTEGSLLKFVGHTPILARRGIARRLAAAKPARRRGGPGLMAARIKQAYRPGVS
jgi:hypothetical protein